MSKGDPLSGPAEIPENKLGEARAIQAKALKGLGPATPLGIWSRGCYWIETTETTDVYKYGTYWKRVACVA
jgi:hypothetical protein